MKINVHAVGPSGAGKTVFMAAMYRQLRFKGSDNGFYLKTDHATSVHMNSVFNAVANPEDEWPAGTKAPSEWEFSVTVPAPAGDFEPLRIKFIDYPGFTLTTPKAAEDERYQEVIEQLKSAHALLVLLDGVGVRACLRGERHGRRFLDFELSSSLELVQQTRCPVQFAITKWDLLEDAHTLAEARDLLLGDDSFRDAISGRSDSAAGTIRLIPVSSVGRGFAAMQPDGQMCKLGNPARPLNVELPFISVLPDFLTYACAELQAKDQGILSRIERYLHSIEIDQFVGRNSGRIAAAKELARRVMAAKLTKAVAARNPLLAAFLPDDATELVDDLFLLVQQVSRRAAAAAEKHWAAGLAAVEDQQSALRLVETQFHEILSRFEHRNPESVLSDPRAAGSGLEDVGQRRPGAMSAAWA